MYPEGSTPPHAYRPAVAKPQDGGSPDRWAENWSVASKMQHGFLKKQKYGSDKRKRYKKKML